MTRSRGCQQCQSRKIKCDRKAPSCGRCEKIGIFCTGPVVGPFFVQFDPHKSVRKKEPESGSRLVGTTIDPFCSLPIQLTERQRYLIHHFITEISPSIFQLDRQGAKFHPLRDIVFPNFVDSKVGFAGIVVYTVNHLASLKADYPTSEAIQSQSQCIRLLQRRISRLDEPLDDYAIFLVLALIATETEIWFKITSQSKQERINAHINGLRQLVIRRGGFVMLARCPKISWHLHWFDIVLFGAISVGLTPLSDHIHSPWLKENWLDLALSTDHRSVQSDSLRSCYYELVGFYCNVYQFAMANTEDFFARSATCFLLSSLLNHGSPLLKYLSGPAETQGLLDKCAVLLYLSATAWDLRNQPPEEIRKYYEKLQGMIADQRLDHSGSLVVLMWVLITDYETMNLQCPERIWLMARSLHILKRAGAQFRRRFEAALLNFWLSAPLSQQIGSALANDSPFAWTPTQFQLDLAIELASEIAEHTN